MTPRTVVSTTAGPALPLADTARRLRRRPGRPQSVLSGEITGLGIQGAALETTKTAGKASDFATPLLPRGLPLPAAAAYSGVPVRALWRLIAAGRLAPVRIPGTRRVLLLREQLDALIDASVVWPREAGSEAR